VIYGTVEENADGTLAWGAPIPPDLGRLAILAVISVVLLILGTYFFKRLEPAFAKVL
jgi:ABC-type polysaccharide/polyol phosphate export permease